MRLSLDTLIDNTGNLLHNPFQDDTLHSSSSSSGQIPISNTISNPDQDGTKDRARIGRGAWWDTQPEAYEPASSTSTHPLRSAGLRLSVGDEYADITRPTLARAVGCLYAHSTPPDRPTAMGPDLAPLANERVVLVHEISPKDSLAGVALRYGITVAALRKSNHLWTSDSIHLRKILYIPLDEASLASPDAASSMGHSESNAHPSSSSSSPSPERHLTNGGLTIRRIPASQLSFFPPPAKPSALAPAPPPPPDTRTNNHTRAPSTPPRTLTSLFTALPIVSRLSFDSASSTSDEQEHELDDVRTTLAPLWDTPGTPRKAGGALGHWRDATGLGGRRHHSHGSYPPADVLAGQRLSWTDEEPARVAAGVRTVQLEPSPGMQLPRHTRSASAGAGSVDSRVTLGA